MSRLASLFSCVASHREKVLNKRSFSEGPIGCQLVHSKKVGGVTCIGINRPDKKNALNYECASQLLTALNSFQSDESSTVGVVYGERGNFCNGVDLDQVRADPELPFKINRLGITELFCSKPLVAAVNGFALGIGCDIALWCDFRVMEDTAVIGGYARNFGLPLSVREAERLCHILGPQRALDWVLTGRIVKAKEAFECGVASRIVACGTAVGQAVNFARGLTNMPQMCLRADRATLLSLGKKYPESSLSVMRQLGDSARDAAIQEARSGLHITRSGDVRDKSSNTPMPDW